MNIVFLLFINNYLNLLLVVIYLNLLLKLLKKIGGVKLKIVEANPLYLIMIYSLLSFFVGKRKKLFE